MGVEVAVEKGAGDGASIPDQAFEAAGAVIAASAAAALKGADLVLKVQRPMIAGEKRGAKGDTDELKNLTKGQALVGQMNALTDAEFVKAVAYAGGHGQKGKASGRERMVK